MNNEEEKLVSDERFVHVRKIFFHYLNQRRDLHIPPEDIEETFIALWIFLYKRDPRVFANRKHLDNEGAMDFYRRHILENEGAMNYLEKLLLSFRNNI